MRQDILEAILGPDIASFCVVLSSRKGGIPVPQGQGRFCNGLHGSTPKKEKEPKYKTPIENEAMGRRLVKLYDRKTIKEKGK